MKYYARVVSKKYSFVRVEAENEKEAEFKAWDKYYHGKPVEDYIPSQCDDIEIELMDKSTMQQLIQDEYEEKIPDIDEDFDKLDKG